MASDPRLRQLKIKTNVVKRYLDEFQPHSLHVLAIRNIKLHYLCSEFELYSLQILPHILRFAVNLLRIGKEVKMYEKEAKDLEEKVKQMESDGKDEYDIRKQV
jgi:hypothetical protein